MADAEDVFPGPDRQAIAVYFAFGPDAPPELTREALAIANSVVAH